MTPPEEHSIPKVVFDSKETSLLSTEEALAMSKRWEEIRPEGPVSVPISRTSFYNLMDKLRYSGTDKKYPRLYFDASRSAMIIQYRPSPLHQNLPMIFSEIFFPIKSTLPAAVRTRILVYANLDTNSFTGRYTGSQKRADLEVSLRDENGNRNVRLVLEVGFAESYEDLIRDAQLWLEGMRSVRVVVLAKYQESPPYKNPLSEEDEETLQLKDASAVKSSEFTMQGEYGPITYVGFTWAGRISEAFIEIWRRHPTTGTAERCGGRMDLFSENTLNLDLSEFLDVDPNDDKTISISSQELMDQLKLELRDLATYRFIEATTKDARANLVDQDYQPISETEDE